MEKIDAVLTLGQRVTALVLDAEEDCSRIALSTAELEENPGDMMVDQARVWAAAEAGAMFYRQARHFVYRAAKFVRNAPRRNASDAPTPASPLDLQQRMAEAATEARENVDDEAAA